jgi:PTH1 family peptidyl-tRNA hydrolase
MSFIILGLGNPGEEYVDTRHNVGRIALDFFHKAHQGLSESNFLQFSHWEFDKKINSLSSLGKVKKRHKVLLLKPETFMNKSGLALRSLVTSAKKAEELIVIHDDLDLPLGKIKISFNKSSGGHRGVESIMKNIKTEAFTRIRVGISPSNAKGVVKKPQGDQGKKAVGDFIISKFKPKELEIIKTLSKKVKEALEMILTEGREKAMGEFNR